MARYSTRRIANSGDKQRKYRYPKKHKCPNCKLRFQFISGLKTHLYVHGKQKPYKCKYCPCTFIRNYRLRAHELAPHKYMCRVCNIGFTCSRMLNEHHHLQTTSNHDQENQQETQVLKHAFAQSPGQRLTKPVSRKNGSKNLNFHTNNDNTVPDESTYKCNFCDCYFLSQQDCENHENAHDNENTETESDTDTINNDCADSGSNMADDDVKVSTTVNDPNLKNSNSSPVFHDCPHCERAFYANVDLLAHIECRHSNQNLKDISKKQQPPKVESESSTSTSVKYDFRNETKEIKDRNENVIPVRKSLRLRSALNSITKQRTKTYNFRRTKRVTYKDIQGNEEINESDHVDYNSSTKSQKEPGPVPDNLAKNLSFTLIANQTESKSLDRKMFRLRPIRNRASASASLLPSSVSKTRTTIKTISKTSLNENEIPTSMSASNSESGSESSSKKECKPKITKVQTDADLDERKKPKVKHQKNSASGLLYICNYCKKSFRLRDGLTRHIRIHTGEKPYVCPYKNCGRAFSQQNNLKEHKRIHTGEKPFSCSVCSKRFARSSSIKRHLRFHSRISKVKAKDGKRSNSEAQYGLPKILKVKLEDILRSPLVSVPDASPSSSESREIIGKTNVNRVDMKSNTAHESCDRMKIKELKSQSQSAENNNAGIKVNGIFTKPSFRGRGRPKGSKSNSIMNFSSQFRSKMSTISSSNGNATTMLLTTNSIATNSTSTKFINSANNSQLPEFIKQVLNVHVVEYICQKCPAKFWYRVDALEHARREHCTNADAPIVNS